MIAMDIMLSSQAHGMVLKNMFAQRLSSRITIIITAKSCGRFENRQVARACIVLSTVPHYLREPALIGATSNQLINKEILQQWGLAK